MDSGPNSQIRAIIFIVSYLSHYECDNVYVCIQRITNLSFSVYCSVGIYFDEELMIKTRHFDV